MSGPRPTHLARRGAVYVARFRIPLKLVDRLGMVELCRSLYTPDAQLARSRCLRATNWFRSTTNGLLQMSNPTRADLEKSARQFFEELKAENDVPRQFKPESLDEELELNIDISRRRIRNLDDQLKVNKFKGYVEGIAKRLVAEMGAKIDDLTASERLITLQLAARVDRERQEHFMHLLTTPAQQYVPRDSLFCTPEIDQGSSEQIAYPANSIVLSKAGAEYLRRKTSEGVGVSLLTELERVLTWFQERVGTDRPVKTISKSELRAFRDDLGKIDVQLRGRKLLFEDRLTDKSERQIKSVTARRYWQSIQGFFRWAEDEGHITVDPAAGLKMAVKKGQVKRSPAPFDQGELKKFCQSPLYSGYQSTKRVSTPGNCHAREGKWWCGILMMFTGMRAAEVSQLLPSDFVFDHEVPHLKIQRVDANGKQVKTVKSDSSLRDVLSCCRFHGHQVSLPQLSSRSPWG